MALVYSIIA